ncbi:TolC family protein [Parabacteroides sp. FAFU027]|uniref:TolC family protein n=1 Tax=Parabacteroides sp. FAFU027 TaxID=2922715 RepID=UPI001FAF3C43|nr:TolC family protein [Parabacteroides sp. FAFU027]
MSFNSKGVCLVVGFLMVSLLSYGQEKWTLQQCIDYAMSHNIQIKQKTIDKESAEIQLHTSKMSRLPDLSGGVNQSFDFGRSLNRSNNIVDNSQSASTGFSLSSNTPIFTGFRITNQIKANEWSVKAAMADLDKVKEDISLNIASSFLQILYNREIYKVAKEQIVLNKELAERAKERVKAGSAAESEVSEANATLAVKESDATTAYTNLQLSLVDLAQLLELDQVKDFDVIEPQIDSLMLVGLSNITDAELIFNQALGTRPSVKAAESRFEQSRNNLAIARSGYFPSLSFGASYSNGYYHTYNSVNPSLSDQLNQNSRRTLGFSLSIPIFNRFETKDQVKQAKNNIIQQQLALESVRKTLRKDIQQAYYNAVASRDKYNASRKSVEASQVAFRFAYDKHSAGKATSYEYNEANNRRLKALSEEIQAKYELVFRCKILDFYMGKPWLN